MLVSDDEFGGGGTCGPLIKLSKIALRVLLGKPLSDDHLLKCSGTALEAVLEEEGHTVAVEYKGEGARDADGELDGERALSALQLIRKGSLDATAGAGDDDDDDGDDDDDDDDDAMATTTTDK